MKKSTKNKLEEAIKTLKTIGFCSSNDFVLIQSLGSRAYVHRRINLMGLQKYWTLGHAMFLTAQKIPSTWL